MRLYDCFTFYNELTLLRLRLETLSPHIERFVLVEATKTFTGKPKPLVFGANRHLFTPWLNKIEHVVVDDMPDEGDAWAREIHQRNAIARGLPSARQEDIIMVSDVDEIPRASTIAPGPWGFGAERAAACSARPLIPVSQWVESEGP